MNFGYSDSGFQGIVLTSHLSCHGGPMGPQSANQVPGGIDFYVAVQGGSSAGELNFTKRRLLFS